LFRYEELSEEAKERVKELLSDDFSAYIASDMLSGMKDTLEKKGVEDIKISYSGFYGQGDGLSYIGTFTTGFVKDFIKDKKYPLISSYIADGNNVNFLILEKREIHCGYVHENSVYVSPDFADISDKLDTELNKLADEINDWRLADCKRMYAELEQQYEYCCSEEYAVENCTDNDYWFTADGKLYE